MLKSGWWAVAACMALGVASIAYSVTNSAIADTYANECCMGGREMTPQELTTLCTDNCDAWKCSNSYGCMSTWIDAWCQDPSPHSCTMNVIYQDMGLYNCVDLDCGIGDLFYECENYEDCGTSMQFLRTCDPTTRCP